MSNSYYYTFVWDKEQDKVVVSYYTKGKSINNKGQVVDVAPLDVTGGPIESDKEYDFLAELGKQYPRDKYIIAGGLAPSLDACVKGFWGLEKDYDTI